jgi:hypothetical protein
LVSVFASIGSHLCNKPRRGDSKNKGHEQCSESYFNNFFSSVKLISVNALPAGARFTQEYFINSILSDILEEKQRILRRNHRGDFFVHMDNSICHNGRKVTDEFANRKLQRVSHPPYSPDLSPCDFWLFGMLKQKMNDREFSGVEEIMNAVQEIWREVI